MSNNEKSNDDVKIKVEPTDEEREIREIKKILDFHPRRAEVGAVIKMEAMELLDEEECDKLRTPYIYGVLSNVEDVCELTGSKLFQIEWATGHINLGNSFMCLIAPYWEHVLTVVRFEDEDDKNDDNEFTKLFQKVGGNWILIKTYLCEFCDSRKCDRALYKTELDEIIHEVKMMEKMNAEKRFSVYQRFVREKHGHLGAGVRKEIDDCVVELTVWNFPVEAGKRKRGYQPTA